MRQYILAILFLCTAISARSQTVADIESYLTAGDQQSWKLDSVSDKAHSVYHKGDVLKFIKSGKQVTVSKGQNAKTATWSVSAGNKPEIILLTIGTNRFEIEFVTQKGKTYLRLRDPVYGSKLIAFPAYYFSKVNE